MNDTAGTDTDSVETQYRATGALAWLLYVVIVFEIIFMVSPAALYYYSAYGLPLNWLLANPYTSWLTQYILPHYTAHDSALGNLLVAVSWPLIIGGALAFIWGFVQIYTARFLGRGAVVAGLYRYIRHPQYTSLAIMGLGTTLFWSRFLVLISFISMMFVYYALARFEESRCLRQYGESYRQYMQSTGRFLPRVLSNVVPDFRLTVPVTFACYVMSLILVVALGWQLKQHVIGQMMILDAGQARVIVLAPMDRSRAEQVIRQVADEIDLNSDALIYLAPASWSIPELGLTGEQGYNQSSAAELAHPTMHGNLADYDGSRFRVLVTTPVYRSPTGKTLADVIEIEPRFRVDIDLETGQRSRIEDLKRGKWAGIPVPVY